MINARKQRKTIEWESLKISSKKIRDTRGTFHAKMGTIKDRNGMDLTEVEDIRRGGKNTQRKYTKKDLHDPENHDDVITNLEPDILDCEVKWALRSIITNKPSRGYGILAELLKHEKMMLLKCCTICQQIWKSQQWPQDWKRSDFIPTQRRPMPKIVQNTT